MKISGIIWLDAIVEKLERKHSVSPAEVVEVLDGHPMFRFVEKGHRQGENLYAALGQSGSGRYLIVFLVHKQNGRALVTSARDMSDRERKAYERR